MRANEILATRDGRCPTTVFRPDDGGPRAGVIVYMDAFGPRPALDAVCERIARHGYVVLLPDLFYRAGPYAPAHPSLFADPAKRKAWFDTYVATASLANVVADTAAFLDFLAAAPYVRSPKVGTTGYCMGGARSLAAAAHYPDRIAAAASYHGGHLVTDAPDSPHRLVARMKARVYVAGADEDPSFPDDAKHTLEQALAAAGVPHQVVTYDGARHGFVPSDSPAHDPAAAERHFETLFALLDAALG